MIYTKKICISCISFIIICVFIILYCKNKNNNETFENFKEKIGNTEIINGSVSNIILTNNYTLNPDKKYYIKIESNNNHKGNNAECTLLEKNGNIYGFILTNSGTGYETAPNVYIYSSISYIEELLEGQNNIIKLIKSNATLNTTLNANATLNENATTTLNENATATATLNATTTTTTTLNETLNAKKYDEIISLNNTKNEKKRQELQSELNKINEDKLTAQNAVLLAKKYGFNTLPPLKYSEKYESKITTSLNNIKTPKVLSEKQKSECYILYMDMQKKSNKLEDLTDRSDSVPQFTINQYGKITQNAINKYNNTCT